jgi:hypothetical protein
MDSPRQPLKRSRTEPQLEKKAYGPPISRAEAHADIPFATAQLPDED